MLLKSLKLFENPVMHDLIYPSRIRGMMNLEYEERQLEGPYIGDQLDETLKLWHPDRAVVIAAPTGTGKTTFTIEKIVKKAIKKGETVLIVTNRNPLNLGYKKDVARTTGLADCYTIKGLQKEKKFGSIYVVNYQALQGFLYSTNDIHFSYVIADECHYFLQDSTFSDCTYTVLNLIVNKFGDSIRLYISATIDEVLPYIARAEMDKNSINHNLEKFKLGLQIFKEGAEYKLNIEMEEQYD
ncbi:MAG: DEAD/DEAH box helicase family protein [Clostridia bacterium]|nr:DEAD/DEAH box helicase family protein [Clostridia bacterium]